MTHPIDTAYVDIVPQDKALERLERDIAKALAKIDKEFEKDLKKIDKDFDDTFANLNKYVDDMEKQATKSFRDLEKVVDNTTNEIESDFKTTFNFVHNKFIELGDESDKSFRRTRAKFLDPLTDGLRNIGSMVGDVGRGMLQLVTGIGGGIASNPLVALILVLTPAIIALAAALSQLIGLVALAPAGFSVLLSVILPMVVAFQNFGDAVSALASGDIEKIDEALKKLSPSAAKVAKEVAALLPMLRSFQKVVQEGLFAPIVGKLTLTVRALFGTFEKGFFDVARAAGQFMSSFAELLALPRTIQVFRETFASTARIITTLMGPILRFIEMLFGVVQSGLPFIERMAAALGRALDTFSKFVNKSLETGQFNQFVEDAITTVKELIDLVKALGGLIGTIFGATEEEGHNFLKTLTDLTVQLDTFLKTADGKAALDALIFAVKALGVMLTATLNTLVFFWQITQRTLRALEMLGRGFVDLVDTVGEWLAKIPGAITSFIGNIPEMVAQIFQNMFDRALQIIGIGTGLILFAIQVLPGKIADFLMSLPQRIYDILVQIGPLVASALQGAVDFGTNIVVNGFNSIVDFIMSVPDRLRALVPSFGKAGTNLIQSFMNGFKSVGGFIGDVAGDIVASVKGFLNKAIDRINSGIETIDNILPGSLARIPRLAQGALVRHRPGGIMANIGEGKEDEVVAPLSKLEGLLQGGQSIVFGADAINVSFSGVVPTESEARKTGKAVGQGILDMISKRNVQAQVRAI